MLTDFPAPSYVRPYSPPFRFVDPTNDVTGLSKYLTALGVLFDPAFSKASASLVQLCCTEAATQSGTKLPVDAARTHNEPQGCCTYGPVLYAVSVNRHLTGL